MNDGIDTTSIVAPAFSNTTIAASRRASTSGEMPSRSSATTPMRRPSTPSFSVALTFVGGSGIDVESIGSWPLMMSRASAGIGDRRAERADLVEARRERDEPVARHAAVRRLHADDAAERRRQADRPAGVRSEPERREVGGHRGRAAARRTAGDATRVVRVRGRPERGVLGGRTHRELVEVRLPDRDATRRRRAVRPRSRCTAASSLRGSVTSTSSGCRACRGCP